MKLIFNNEKNFIHEKISKEDRELFLGPILKNEEFIVFNDEWDMSDIIVETGKFASRGQAKKNGWKGKIPDGFSDFVIGKGKNKMELFILNNWEDQNETT